MRGELLLAAMLLLYGCAGTEQPSEGIEQGPDPVPDCFGPVCGLDGITYETDCQAEIAGADFAYGGPCIEPEEEEGPISCMDSDGGAVKGIKGQTTKGDTSYSDHCIDEAQLMEYSCVDDSIIAVSILCSSEEVCEDGACRKEPVHEVDPGCHGPSSPDILVADSVISNGSEHHDVCVDFTTVKDYFCRNNALLSLNNECPPGYGCAEGRCYLPNLSCKDSDGGFDLSVKGRVSVTRGLFSTQHHDDKCIDRMVIEEWFCQEDGTASSSELWCPSGTKCSEGRCIRSKCADTDGGKDIYVKGHVQIKGQEWTDHCHSDSEVAEYFCDGDDENWTILPCGEGFLCDGGRCVPMDE